ncbi:PH domain-containing protein [Flavobacteriaceae bacterium]|nr:PH domain-containing protein [Flavobacteriaceae bacterium]
MIYYSKVSYTLLIFVFLVFFGPLVPNFISNGFNANTILAFSAMVVLYGFILHMFFNTTYKIEKGKLYIKCGFFNYNPVNIGEMKKISKSSNIISSPAASFDRIEITYGKFEELIISPKHKTKFVEDLQKINPGIINNL